MSIEALALHFRNIIYQKLEPIPVRNAILHRFYIGELRKRGMNVPENISSEAVSQIWQNEIDEKGVAFTFDPRPSPYALVPCYNQIYRGLGKLHATRYRGTENSLDTLSPDGEVLESNKPLRPGNPILALQCLIEADEVVKAWLDKVNDSRNMIVVEFSLSDSQLKEFSVFYHNA